MTQKHADVQDAELQNVTTLSTHYRSYHKSLPGQKQVGDKLSLLHHKEATLMSTESFETTLNTWLKHLNNKDLTVLVHKQCGNLVEQSFGFKQFSNEKGNYATVLPSVVKEFSFLVTPINIKFLRTSYNICTKNNLLSNTSHVNFE